MLKAAYSTKRIPKCVMKTLLTGTISPKTGDLVLAQIINTHVNNLIELVNGVRAPLKKGDFVILCFDNRNVPEQFEACIPAKLEPCHMLSTSGMAAKLSSRNSCSHLLVDINPIGIIGDDSRQPLNISDWSTIAH